MAKTRKRRNSKPIGKRPLPKLAREVGAAMELYENGDVAAARQQLLKLQHQQPRSLPVLYALLEVSQETEDWRTIAFCSEQLLLLERGEDRADTLNNLVLAHVKLGYSALAWQHASDLITQYPHYAYVEQSKKMVELVEPLLWNEIEETMGDQPFTREEKFELRVMHDRVRFLTESGRSAEAIQVSEQLLDKIPTMLPILNNLSLSQFMVGDVETAITTAQQVIAQEPGNFHALSNLVRFCFLTAQFEQAQVYASQLQAVTDDKPDFELKQAEAFSFLGDDHNVWKAYERAKTRKLDKNPLLLHLAAVASYRLGHEKRAWQLWQQAAKEFPGFEMAQDSLAEKRLPVEERNVPWYWPFSYWFPQDFHDLLEKHLGNIRRMNERGVERAMKTLLAERPYLPALFPHILERGDHHARQFVLNFIRIVETPELLSILYDFAQSRYGSDAIRLEAIQAVAKKCPSLLPEDKNVPMWIKGKQTELFMLGFDISFEPEPVPGVPEEILDKYEITYDLLMANKPAQAEKILHEMIAEAPEFYSAYNQLAVAYERQGRREEARALVEETHARFPDYLFARVALARLLVQEKRVEEAKELVAPLMRLSKLHITEFKALARVQMDMALANEQPEAARGWLEMWQSIDEDDDELMQWRLRIEGPGQFLAGLQKLMGRQRKKR
jgi:tetratricopeptide (TPR) repeat protein